MSTSFQEDNTPQSPQDTRPPYLVGNQAATGGYRRTCPTCDAPISSGQTVCTGCGRKLAPRPAVVRCRHCGGRSSSELVLCPHCGRELQSASSRLLTLAAPLFLVILLAVLLMGRLGLISPFAWAQNQIGGSLQVINNVAITPVRADPEATDPEPNGLIALRPLAPIPAQPPTESSTAPAPDGAVVSPIEGGESLLVEEADGATLAPEVPTEEVLPLANVAPANPAQGAQNLDPVVVTVTPTPTAADAASVPLPLPGSETATVTESVAETAVTPLPQAEADSEPTAEQLPAAPPPTTATATTTDEDGVSAAELKVTVDAARLARTQTPALTATRALTPTATPLPMASYTVRVGDTLVAVAERFDLPLETILQANGIGEREAADLRSGQVLRLPGVTNPSEEQDQAYVMRPGDTLVTIALRFSVTTQSIMRLNGLSEAEARNLQVGETILIPAAGTVENATSVESASTPVLPTPVGTTAPLEYTVRSGDTMVVIAARYDLPTRDLMAFNNLTETQARALQPGDVLLIPRQSQEIDASPITSTPTMTSVAATATPSATPTPTSTATDIPTATPDATDAYRLDAPRLLQPTDGVLVLCDGTTQYIQWRSVNGLARDDSYVLFLGYVHGSADSNSDEPVTWVVRQDTGQRTFWRLDPEYCNLAPQRLGQRWKWYVQIFNENIAVSPPSVTRAFTWR